MTITRPTFPTNNVTSKGVTPTVDGSAMLEAVDKIGVDVKAYLNSLTTELESTTAGNDIGVVATGVVANKLNAALTELQGNIVSASTGQIPNNSLSELKMATDMKKQAGGVAAFDTVTTLAGNLTNLSTKTDGMEEELDIMRTAKDSTGTTNAYILDTPATFDFAVDGNLVHFNPNFTNTGAVTIAIDGITRDVKKFDIDTDSYVDLEPGDIKKNNPAQFRNDTSEVTFCFAPKGRGVKSVQEIETTMNSQSTKTIGITTVDYYKSYVLIEFGSSTSMVANHECEVELNLAGNQVTITYGGTTYGATIIIKVIEEYSLKSKQVVTGVIGVGTTNAAITSVGDTAFSILETRSTSTGSNINGINKYSVIDAATNVKIVVNASDTTYRCQIIER